MQVTQQDLANANFAACQEWIQNVLKVSELKHEGIDPKTKKPVSIPYETWEIDEIIQARKPELKQYVKAKLDKLSGADDTVLMRKAVETQTEVFKHFLESMAKKETKAKE